MTGWRPGERRADSASMLRVDQAGEYGATRIYAGQLAVLRANCAEAKLISRMAAQEQRHLGRFDRLIADRGVRPTALQPLWNVAGFALGAVTALISPEAALACTDAVETEIDLVPNKAKPMPITVALSNSFGFGGTNASVVFKKIT